ncbi:thermonuclease family protein [Halogranum rubrum]|uniref:TNase-like domain-containing protein n=1 Tax=Halogranum salarium B-1 TaxID=1210908 RepID=J3EX36_9EURY|nr:thermonuclease family protein [Halogranum salarium]EJN59587.1 hypothetical protein HSB1_17450 [Halogranum salarium B-1]
MTRWAKPTLLVVLLLTSGCLGDLFGAERPTTDDAHVDLHAGPAAPLANDVDSVPTDVAPDETSSQPPSATQTPVPVDPSGPASVTDVTDAGPMAEEPEANGTDVDAVPFDGVPAVDASPPSVPVVVAPARPSSESVGEAVAPPAPTTDTPATAPDAGEVVDQTSHTNQTSQTNTTASETRSATVLTVVDGDTVRVAFADGEVATVDLAGVDAPELYTSTTPALFSPVPNSTGGEAYLHVWGWTADRALNRELSGESVEVVIVSSTAIAASDDPYVVFDSPETVYVAYVGHEERSVNLALVASGLVRTTDDEHPRRETFVAVEMDARANGRGLWAVTDPLSVP